METTITGEPIVHGSWIVAVRSNGATQQSEVPGEALRPATTDDLHRPGQQVRTPDDTSGDAFFLRQGYEDEAQYVESPATESGKRLADVAWIRHRDGKIVKWPYADLVPAV
jgi:hypothetical protein